MFVKILRYLLFAVFVINILTTSALFSMIMFVAQHILSDRALRLLSCLTAWFIGLEAVFIGGWLCNLKVILYGEDADVDQLHCGNYLVNMNHRYELDFLTAWTLGAVADIVQSAKVCLKEELKHAPILGKVWQAMGYIFLDREWNKDRQNLDKACAILNNYPCPYIVLIFCEGTRFTDAKRDSSNEYAKKQGLKELKHHLVPRTRGFLHLLHSLRPTLSGIYDVTCSMEGPKPSVLNMLSGKELVAHCHVRRFDISTFSEDNEECSKWLFKLYEEKDALTEGFIKNGYFPGNVFRKGIPIWALIISLTFLVFYTVPAAYFVLLGVLSLPPICLYITAAGLLIITSAVGYKIWGYTQMSKASSYGLKSKGLESQKNQ